jgi:hypothetical protein
LQLASLRCDGELRPYVTMWVVRAGGDLYVRSVYGPDNPWFRRAKASGAGRVRAGRRVFTPASHLLRRVDPQQVQTGA